VPDRGADRLAIEVDQRRELRHRAQDRAGRRDHRAPEGGEEPPLQCRGARRRVALHHHAVHGDLLERQEPYVMEPVERLHASVHRRIARGRRVERREVLVRAEGARRQLERHVAITRQPEPVTPEKGWQTGNESFMGSRLRAPRVSLLSGFA